MNGDATQVIAKIMNAIDHGKLSVEETEKRLKLLVEQEVECGEREADMELVNACEDLLWELGTNGQLPFESNQEYNRKEVMRRIQKSERNSLVVNLRRVLLAAAAIVLLVVFGDILLRKTWFTGTSTEDEQQYVIQAHEIDPQLIASSIAAHEGVAKFVTSDFNEVVEYLGFVPQTPKGLPEGWIVDRYSIIAFPELIQVTTTCREASAAEAGAYLEVKYFTDLDTAYITFEQSSKGSVQTIGASEVYLSENIDMRSFCWQNGTVVYRLDGKLDVTEMVNIVKSVLGVVSDEKTE